jgi:hypothetical protein
MQAPLLTAIAVVAVHWMFHSEQPTRRHGRHEDYVTRVIGLLERAMLR